MYKNELKGLSISNLKKVIKELEKLRNSAQAQIDILSTSTNKVNKTTKKELRAALRFAENSLNTAIDVKEDMENHDHNQKNGYWYLTIQYLEPSRRSKGLGDVHFVRAYKVDKIDFPTKASLKTAKFASYFNRKVNNGKKFKKIERIATKPISRSAIYISL